MFLKLFRLLPGRVWLIGALVAAVVGGWLWHQTVTARLELAVTEAQFEADSLRRGRDAWQARANRYRDDLVTAIAEQAHAERAVRELQDSLAEVDERYRALRQRIARAPAEDDGPVAPVLRDTLEALP
ncbi:hypothetical protein [Halomonas sp. HG01]|uniref:hypothetical protein n=1 Tax=Halomonas sp. HG01 TaxID=1609967 RepID=UPI00061480F4|nr:hypothetical protein [Halomonas sp. HG01]